jgi:hypothetical protein
LRPTDHCSAYEYLVDLRISHMTTRTYRSLPQVRVRREVQCKLQITAGSASPIMDQFSCTNQSGCRLGGVQCMVCYLDALPESRVSVYVRAFPIKYAFEYSFIDSTKSRTISSDIQESSALCMDFRTNATL